METQIDKIANSLKDVIFDLRNVANGEIFLQDIQFAIQALLSHQFVFEKDRQSRAYKTIRANSALVEALVEIMGFKLHLDHFTGVAGILLVPTYGEDGAPKPPPIERRIGVQETALLLILRHLYDIGMRSGGGEPNDPGVVAISTDEIVSAILEHCPKRQYKLPSAMMTDLKTLENNGLIRIGDKIDDEILIVDLLPTLPIVTGEDYTKMLNAFSLSNSDKGE